MKSYPYIGQYQTTNTETNVLYYKQDCCIHMDDKEQKTTDRYREGVFKNITREYLQNTYGEVVSPEHAEFIIELAESAGFKVWSLKRIDEIKTFTFENGELCLLSFHHEGLDSRKLKQITIPLPPKAESKKWTPDFYELGEPPKHFDCVCNKCSGKCCTGQCDKQESSEWPQVGDEVTLVSMGMAMYNKPVKLTYIGDGVGCYIDLTNSMEYTYAKRETVFEKPKTPEEELRDELIEYLNELGSSARYCFGGNELAADELLKSYNIKKKPQ